MIASEKKRRVVTGMMLIVGAGSMLLVTACGKKQPAKPRPPVPVAVAAAALKAVPVQLRAVGNVEPSVAVAVKAQVNGQLAQVHFREGQDVGKGQLLFTIDRRPLEAALKQAEAALARNQAQARYAQEQARRYATLLKDGIVTQDQYDQVRANAEALEATVVADRAAVENAGIQLGYCTIRSPIEGRTGTVMVQPGNLVKANDNPVLVTVNRITPSFVTFSVPEKNLPDIKRYLAQGTLRVAAEIPNDTGGVEWGTVSFLDNAVDPATGTIRLKGTFANSSRRLWPGQFVNVLVTLNVIPDAVVVPSAAVQAGQQGPYVFVVKEDGTAELRQVAAGVTQDGFVVIQQGLRAGETVVIDGQMRVVPGAKVEVQTPMAAGPTPGPPAGAAAPKPAVP